MCAFVSMLPLTDDNGNEVSDDDFPVNVLLRACCNQEVRLGNNGWFATDDRDGQPVDLDAESANGWEWFRDYRDRVIGSVGDSTEG